MPFFCVAMCVFPALSDYYPVSISRGKVTRVIALLCQEYLLQSDGVIYPIRPRETKTSPSAACGTRYRKHFWNVCFGETTGHSACARVVGTQSSVHFAR